MSITLAKRIRMAAVLAVAAVLGLAGVAAAGDWPMFRHDPAHTGNSGENVNPPRTLAWTYKVDGRIVPSPAIVKAVVYFGSQEQPMIVKSSDPKKPPTRQLVGAMHAVDLKTGRLLWKYMGPKEDPLGWVNSSPAVVNGIIYFTSYNGYLYALDTNGNLKWKFKSPTPDEKQRATEMSSPTVAGGTVFYGSAFPNKDVLAVDIASKKLKWRFPTGQMIYSSPAVVDGKLYIGSDDGKFYALDAATGKEKWSYSTTGGVFFHSPMVAGGLLICAAGDYDRSINALSLADGRLQWSFNSDTSNNYVSSPAIGSGIVYICTGHPEQKIYALDAKTGKEKWHAVLGFATSQMFSSSPAVAGDTVYVGSGPAKQGEPSGKIYGLDAATGKVKWEYTTDNAIVASPAVSNGMVVVGSLGGTLYAFQGTSGPAPKGSAPAPKSTAAGKPIKKPTARR